MISDQTFDFSTQNTTSVFIQASEWAAKYAVFVGFEEFFFPEPVSIQNILIYDQ